MHLDLNVYEVTSTTVGLTCLPLSDNVLNIQTQRYTPKARPKNSLFVIFCCKPNFTNQHRSLVLLDNFTRHRFRSNVSRCRNIVVVRQTRTLRLLALYFPAQFVSSRLRPPFGTASASNNGSVGTLVKNRCSTPSLLPALVDESRLDRLVFHEDYLGGECG